MVCARLTRLWDLDSPGKPDSSAVQGGSTVTDDKKVKCVVSLLSLAEIPQLQALQSQIRRCGQPSGW